MATAFLVSLIVGGVVLGFQILMSFIGFDGHDGSVPDADVGGSDFGIASELFSIRAIGAALLVFGATGMLLDNFVALALAALLAVPTAIAAALLAAWLTLQLLKLESDGSIQIENAIGTIGTVYLPVPTAIEGSTEAHGLVHVTVQGRTIEVRAITTEANPLPTGSSVVIVAAEGDTVEVVSTPLIEGIR